MFRQFICIACLVLAHSATATPSWRWHDDFSSREKQKLTEWILHAEQGMSRLFGPLPYRYSVHFHRMKKGRGPTPWANTDKRRGRAVHFYVNTAYAWSAFEKDWTASHELSHLMFPYIGTSGRWFAEGLASYLQYQIMYASGTVKWKQVINRYAERFNAARRQDTFGSMAITSISNLPSLKDVNVRLYWGGATYFLLVDRALKEQKNIRLHDVISAYLECCMFRKYSSAEEMIKVFDSISESEIFTEYYLGSVSQRGFPGTRESLGWLESNPPALKAIDEARRN